MIALVQRVNWAKVRVDNKVISSIDKGLLILLGIKSSDNDIDINYLIKKIINFKIFSNNNHFDLSIKDTNYPILIVPQFTLYANLKKGNKASFTNAMESEKAEIIYNKFCNDIKNYGINVFKGKFKSYMKIESENDGPVTFLFNHENN